MSVPKQLIGLQQQIYRATIGEPTAENVMPWLLDRRNLEAAWDRVRSTDGANTPGPDGRTVRDIAPRKSSWLSRLASQLYQGQFRPSQPLWVHVPKSSDSAETRRIGILNVTDRVVHAALKQVLEPMIDPRFSPLSFGFRPGRSVPGALAAAVDRLNGARGGPTFRYLAKLDVANCFDSIDHRLLLERLRSVARDEDVERLIEGLLAAGGCQTGRLWWKRSVGVAQGSSLSPLLCNLYLDRIDLHGDDTSHRHPVCLLRYADDVLLLAGDRASARQAASNVKRSLAQLRMRTKHDKTEIVAAASGIRWLGVDLRPRESSGQRTEFAYFVPDDRVAKMLTRIEEMTVPPSTRIDASAFDLGRWLVSINDQLRDWWAAYRFAENSTAIFRRVDEHTDRRVYDLLASITGLRGSRLRRQFRIPLPRGFFTWQVEGSRLVVLSSLAPRRPTYLTRRPLWMRPTRRRNQSFVMT